MKSCRKFYIVILLTFASFAFSLQAYAQQELGIYFPHPQEAQFSKKLEQAFGNLVTVSNYQDKGAMIKMLTRFNQLDAVLINKQTYREHNSATLIPLTEATISGETSVELVLATHSLLTKAEQESLIQGYQNLLLSENGLELLEIYAMGKWSAPQEVEVAHEKKSTSQKPSLPKKQQVIASPKAPSSPKPQKRIPATPQKGLLATDLIVAKKNADQELPQAQPKLKASIPEKTKRPKEQTKNISENLWRPHVDITSKLGNDKSLGELELFIPVAQNRDRLFFLDMRFQLDDNDETEGNFGLGLRKMMNNTWILGGYAFYDRRESFYNNDFQQVTLGVEAITEEYDARINAYLAEDKEYLVARQESVDRIIFSGTKLLYQTGGLAFETREKAMSGFDAELGWQLPWFDTPEIRGYLGGYHFTASGTEDISGPRGRMEVRFPDIFGWTGSLFELGGEVRYDDVRDTDYFVSARGRIPFGKVTQAVQKSKGISARMTERIQRDPDIVVAKYTNDTSTPFRSEILTSNNTDIEVAHVDSNSSAGDGSISSPHNSLAAGVSSGSDIVLLHADSTFDEGPVSLEENQKLLGATVPHTITINTDNFGLINFTPQIEQGQMPVIMNSLGGNAIELANGSEVSGVAFSNIANAAIYGNNVGGVSINRNIISNVDVGIDLSLASYAEPSVISNNVITDTTWDGIVIFNDTPDPVSINVTNNQLQNIDGYGIIFDNFGGGDMSILASGNNITGTTVEGITGFNQNLGSTLSATLVDNTVSNVGAGFDGLYITNEGDTVNLYLQNNHISGNGLADYFLDNLLGVTFNLGASSGNSFIGQSLDISDVDDIKDIFIAEGNTRADMTTGSLAVEVDGTIDIVDKSTIPTP